VLQSCLQTVRKEYIRKTIVEDDSISKAKAKTILNPKQQFADTLVMNITPHSEGKQTDNASKQLDKEWKSANQFFDKGEYKNAKDMFTTIAESTSSEDSIHCESTFMIAECLVQLNELPKAKEILYALSNNTHVSTTLLEKVLIRSGQVLCALDDVESATIYFKRLQIEYPQSRFSSMATCNSVVPK
jgi:TolA-binding protein